MSTIIIDRRQDAIDRVVAERPNLECIIALTDNGVHFEITDDDGQGRYIVNSGYANNFNAGVKAAMDYLATLGGFSK